jgi:hypothetical protein
MFLFVYHRSTNKESRVRSAIPKKAACSLFQHAIDNVHSIKNEKEEEGERDAGILFV